MYRFGIGLLLLVTLLAGPAPADPQADYERLKIDIQEQRRELNILHGRRHYKSATELQTKIAQLARRALELALGSPRIGNSGALSYHASVMAEMGRYQEALQALDQYMRVPMLNRSDLANGWRKRAEVHKRAGDSEGALRCYQEAAALVERPRDRFHLLRSQARILIEGQRNQEALDIAAQLPVLIEKMEPERRDSAKKEHQSLLARILREQGDVEGARRAKKRELELRKLLLDRELAEFDHKYPATK